VTPGFSIPQLDPLPLAGPAWLLWTLLLVTFFLHVIAMNLVLGGSIIGLNARLRGTAPHRTLASWLSIALPVAVAATVTLGVAPLLFVQALYGRLFFPSAVTMAWAWFAVVPILITGYYGVYLLAYKGERLGRLGLVVSAGTVACFVAIAFLYSTNMSLMLRPEAVMAKYQASAAGWHFALDDRAFLPRYLHMVLGAMAVAGLIVAELGVFRQSRGDADARWITRHGSIWFTLATIVNIVVGTWWLLALPRETVLRLMGQDVLGTLALVAGVLFAIVALALGAMAIPAPQPKPFVRSTTILVGLVLVTMVLLRDQVRAAAFDRVGFAVNPWQDPQWGPIALFLVLLVAAAATIAWMVVVLARAGTETPRAEATV
jgi:hypothetical protein